MKPIEFPEQNAIASSNDANVQPLPCRISEDGTQVISCWELTEADFERLKRNPRIYVSQMTYGGAMLPLFLTTNKHDLFTYTSKEAKRMCLRDKSKVCDLCHECDIDISNPRN